MLLKRKMGGSLDLYCCDMNAPPAFVTDLFLEALPLMKPGAAVVRHSSHR